MLLFRRSPATKPHPPTGQTVVTTVAPESRYAIPALGEQQQSVVESPGVSRGRTPQVNVRQTDFGQVNPAQDPNVPQVVRYPQNTGVQRFVRPVVERYVNVAAGFLYASVVTTPNGKMSQTDFGIRTPIPVQGPRWNGLLLGMPVPVQGAVPDVRPRFQQGYGENPVAADVTPLIPGTPRVFPYVAKLPVRPVPVSGLYQYVGKGPSKAPAAVVATIPARPVVVTVAGRPIARIVPVVGQHVGWTRLPVSPTVVASRYSRRVVPPVVGAARIAATVVTTTTPIAPTVVRLPQRPSVRVLPIVGVGHFGGTTASVPDEAQRGGSSRRWKDQWRRTRPLPLKTITVTVEVPDVVEQPVEPGASPAPPAYKKLAIPLTVPAVPVAEPSLQPVADALLAMRTTYQTAPIVDWQVVEAELMRAFHAEQARIRAEWTRKAILAVLLIEES